MQYSWILSALAFLISIICVLCGIYVFLALYVNRVFINKLKENTNQIRFQKLLSKISYDFLSINQSNKDEKINNMLEKLGSFLQADHAYVCLFNQHQDNMTCSCEWSRSGTESQKELISEVPLDTIPWQMGYIEDVNKLPDKADDIKYKLINKNIKSFISIPIEEKGMVNGFIGIESSETLNANWTDEYMETLGIFANLLTDGLAKVKAENDIKCLAYCDHLTGLPNRTLFADRVNQAINMGKRSKKTPGIMFIDLDSFKTVNDTMGHNGGDMLIKEVANALSQSLRKIDTVARFGGDEFMILLNNMEYGKDVTMLFERIMATFQNPFIINGKEFFITASAGVAIYPEDGKDSETLIKNADIAMYKAKSLGKNRYCLCTSDIKEQVYRDAMISNSMYRILERNELGIYYQPQLSLETGEIIGLEALARWQHPEFGLISPEVFIPLAEKNGLINKIGEWVLRNACIQNANWHKVGISPLKMAVNISGNQFKNPRLVDMVENILKETGLAPQYLELEITESVAIKENDYIIGILNRLKKLGVSISIDDFGTEYSSLSRLKILPIDRIKIDMQFIQGIEGSEKDQAITMIIINLAKSLGLKVIAEGVETIPQLDFLNQKMCDEAQGFYYYKPMPANEIEVILQQSAV